MSLPSQRKSINHFLHSPLILLSMSVLGIAILADLAYVQTPFESLSKDKIIQLLTGRVSPLRVAELARQRSIDFSMTPEVEREFRSIGATDVLVEELRRLAPKSTELLVQSEPAGATLYINENRLGTTSQDGLRISALKPGEYKIRFVLQGYQDKEESVHLSAGATSHITAKLSPTEPPSNSISSRPMLPEFAPKPTRILPGQGGAISSLAFSPNGRWLAAGLFDGTTALWEIGNNFAVHRLAGHSNSVKTVVFSPDSNLLASGSYDKTIRLWDVATGKLVHILTGHTDMINGVSFSPDGRRLASGSQDRTVRLYDVATMAAPLVLSRHTYAVLSVAFSPDDSVLASASEDDTIRLWDAHSGRELRALEFAHTSSIRAVAFSPDGLSLASASDDQTVKIWDVSSWQTKRTLPHGSPVISVVFGPNARWLVSVTGGTENRIRLWSFPAGQEDRREFQQQNYKLEALAISKDGSWLALGGREPTVKLWRMK